MTPPIFIPEDESQQVAALKEYLVNLGVSELSNESSSQGWPSEIASILHGIKKLWSTVIPDGESDDLLTTVVTLILLLPPEVCPGLVNEFCSMCESLPVDMSIKKQTIVLGGLNILIDGLEKGRSKLRVYQAILTCCQLYNFVAQPVTDNEKIAKWLNDWQCTEEERQSIWRRLRDIHLALDQKELAADAMIRLLTSYSDVTAMQARDDAIQCIVTAVMDPTVLSMDHILLLKPVKLLEGTPIHNLLTIFVSGSLNEFEEFVAANNDFLNQCKLVSEDCRAKIKVLAFMRMAEGLSEIAYDEIMRELRLSEDDVEEFIIEAARQRAVNCKLDQVRRLVTISGSLPLTFDREHWIRLRNYLQRWRDNVALLIPDSMPVVAN
jgi:translation initiation factor 3 subunit M